MRGGAPSRAQAEDRCHRLGQTRPVTVHRLVAADSVDQKIVAIATRKLSLDQARAAPLPEAGPLPGGCVGGAGPGWRKGVYLGVCEAGKGREKGGKGMLPD